MEQTRDFQDLLVNFPKPFCVLVQHLPKNRILKTIYFVEILSEKSHPKGIYFVEILSDSSAPVGIIHRKTSSETFVNPTSNWGHGPMLSLVFEPWCNVLYHYNCEPLGKL
jgi:hypothetical protein